MKIKYILSVIAIVAFTKNTFAQYSQDAVRFSGAQTGSSARIKALGNAGTAVGGDVSSVSGNPAGLGFFTKSEISITPEFDGSKVGSNYFGQSNSDKSNTGNLNNAAIVIYQQLSKPRGADKNKGWLSFNYGAAYSRTNNFTENIFYGGSNPNNTINNYYANQANSFGINQGTLGGAAFDHNLIDYYNSQKGYASNAFGTTSQLSGISRSGGQSALDISFGSNYSNNFYIGLGLSFTDTRYNSFSTFNEAGSLSVQDVNGVVTNNTYKSSFTKDQVTRGSGFSARLGVIYKPVETVRLGAVFTSPTFYNINDSYREGLSTQISNGNNYTYQSQDYTLTYNLRTPLKVAGGAAVFIGHAGFITGDVEYVDYGSAHLSSNGSYDNSTDNSDIKSLYKSTVNVHVGAEARLTSLFLLRGGYGITGDPRKINGSDIKTVSGGFGLRFGSVYVDATYTHATSSQTIFPYEIGALSPSALLNRTNDNGYLTLGYRF